MPGLETAHVFLALGPKVAEPPLWIRHTITSWLFLTRIPQHCSLLKRRMRRMLRICDSSFHAEKKRMSSQQMIIDYRFHRSKTCLFSHWIFQFCSDGFQLFFNVYGCFMSFSNDWFFGQISEDTDFQILFFKGTLNQSLFAHWHSKLGFGPESKIWIVFSLWTCTIRTWNCIFNCNLHDKNLGIPHFTIDRWFCRIVSESPRSKFTICNSISAFSS